MKKFICTALCSLIALSSVSLAACSDNSDSGLINLADCEIGYELPVYPDCEFDYKIDDDCIVHISEIKAVLTAKNEINEGDVIDKKFYLYDVTVYADGETSYQTDKTFYFYVQLAPQDRNLLAGTAINTNTLHWEISFSTSTYFGINFQMIELS